MKLFWLFCTLCKFEYPSNLAAPLLKISRISISGKTVFDSPRGEVVANLVMLYYNNRRCCSKTMGTFELGIVVLISGKLWRKRSHCVSKWLFKIVVTLLPVDILDFGICCTTCKHIRSDEELLRQLLKWDQIQDVYEEKCNGLIRIFIPSMTIDERERGFRLNLLFF